MVLLLISGLLPSSAWAQSAGAPFEVKKHVVLDQLGSRHLGNVVYRRGADGGYFVGWGRTPIQQWPYGSANQTQVVPALEGQRYSNGGTVLDVDGDGADEVVVTRGEGEGIRDSKLYWFDEVEGQTQWQEHYIADTGEGNWVAPHDVEAFTASLPSGEEVRGVIANVDRHEVFFFEAPEDPTAPWERHAVGAFPVSESQSGMEIVDVNGDGRKDIVSGMFWIETPADPRQDGWTFHRYGTWDHDNGRWGGMIMYGVADFDGDGQVEIVAAEAETPGARVGLFDRQEEDGTGLWEETLIEDDLYAPHSVAVGDLDEDGRADFVVGEMTAGGWDHRRRPLRPAGTAAGERSPRGGDGARRCGVGRAELRPHTGQQGADERRVRRQSSARSGAFDAGRSVGRGQLPKGGLLPQRLC